MLTTRPHCRSPQSINDRPTLEHSFDSGVDYPSTGALRPDTTRSHGSNGGIRTCVGLFRFGGVGMNDHPVDGVGYLEQREYRRFVWAWEHAGKIASFLYGAGKVNSAGETDVRVDSSSAPSTPLDATWLAADEISSHLHALNAYPDSETAAKHKIGQYHAIELGRCVSTRRPPLAHARQGPLHQPHAVRRLRRTPPSPIARRGFPSTASRWTAGAGTSSPKTNTAQQYCVSNSR